VIGQGHVALIDLGRIGDRYFVNHVATGASTLVSRSLSAGSKRWLGKLAYLLAAIKACPRMRSFEVKLIMDDEETLSKCMQVVAGNGRHHAGPFLLSPDASRSNGKLLVYWLASDERKRLLLLMRGLRSGHHIDMPDVECREVERVRIETSRPIGVSIDGELGFRTPIELSIDRKALRVFVPPPASV
jgi:diacylglycerol kinase family enzyme